jgi:hypothetical protein
MVLGTLWSDRPKTVWAALCILLLAGSSSLAGTPGVDTPYYGGFGPGFLHLNANGTYGKGEIRSGELGTTFYGPEFGGPYSFKMYVRHDKGEWDGDLVAGPASPLRVTCLPLFPMCQYKFEHGEIPLQIEMEGFAPWISGDSKLSSLPVLFFDFQLTNPDASEKSVALAFTIPNPEADGGTPVRDKDGKIAGVVLQSKRAGGGTLCGIVRNDGDARASWGGDFTKGALNGAAGNMIASSLVLPAHATRHLVFVFAWDFPVYVSGDGRAWPRKELGHYHNNFYHGADAIALDCRAHYRSIHSGVRAWFDRMWADTNLPEWMRRQILINTSHMAYNGVFFKNGCAAVKEGNDFDLVGTYDEQFQCSFCELLFLPQAEWGNLRIFSDIQLPNGAIRHDLGSGCVTATPTSPDHGAPWPGQQVVKGDSYWNAGDNTPEWILDLYRDYLWTGDLARLKTLWPNVAKGCAYMLAGDKSDLRRTQAAMEPTHVVRRASPAHFWKSLSERAGGVASAVGARRAGLGRPRQDVVDPSPLARILSGKAPCFSAGSNRLGRPGLFARGTGLRSETCADVGATVRAGISGAAQFRQANRLGGQRWTNRAVLDRNSK